MLQIYIGIFQASPNKLHFTKPCRTSRTRGTRRTEKEKKERIGICRRKKNSSPGINNDGISTLFNLTKNIIDMKKENQQVVDFVLDSDDHLAQFRQSDQLVSISLNSMSISHEFLAKYYSAPDNVWITMDKLKLDSSSFANCHFNKRGNSVGSVCFNLLESWQVPQSILSMFLSYEI